MLTLSPYHFYLEDNANKIAEKAAIIYLRYIHEKVHAYKFNYLAFFTGKHRVGKSLTSLTIGNILDPTFFDSLETRVVYYPNDFMKALREIREKKIIGGVVIWDEAGVGIPAREWYEISNKAINKAVQVFGKYRPIVFFVTQDVTYIDSQVRKLFHGFYEMYRADNTCSYMVPFNVRYNKRQGKIYFSYTRIYSANEDVVGRTIKLKVIAVKRPSKELEDRYEQHSAEFKDRIMDQMEERTEAFLEGKIERKKMSVSEIVKDLVENRREDSVFLSKKSSPEQVLFDPNAIMYHYNVPNRLAIYIKKRAEKEINNKPLVDEEE